MALLLLLLLSCRYFLKQAMVLRVAWMDETASQENARRQRRTYPKVEEMSVAVPADEHETVVADSMASAVDLSEGEKRREEDELKVNKGVEDEVEGDEMEKDETSAEIFLLAIRLREADAAACSNALLKELKVAELTLYLMAKGTGGAADE